MISDLEKIIHQKDENINSLDCEIKQKISEIELDHYRHLKDIQDKYDQKTEQIQNEIKQIKTENEANIKAIKQKNKEKYQQLETENKNRIENLAEILNEKEVKITALDGNITRTNQLIQTLETRINRNENAHLNDIEMLSHNILQKGEKINSMEIQNRTVIS
uniref:Uncharacterized protein n=1 Tax=Meloidogyne floridensis TaxID=298350 RepID=A0A915P0R1_9BILA